ncbi:MAG TPA: DUF1080 domain-containing protein [Mucilaginibacter sp.]|jgi:hypothetical protein|nr:DUF1080 domain-containing protein [Mucilaginibacter sp.]
MKTSLKLAIIPAVICLAGFTMIKPQQKSGWVSLFDGKTLTGWHEYGRKGPITDWTVQNGALVSRAPKKKDDHSYITTDKKYANFELKWEWKADKGSNSGVIYHVQEDAKHHSPYETGPEYQIIDDNGFPAEKLEEWQKAGADYGMHPANSQKKLMPVGQWNTSRLIFNHGHVEHWLNGKKIVEFIAWDADWNKKRLAGKWKDYPDYGKAKTGVIALQCEAGKVYYKNIMIKEL